MKKLRWLAVIVAAVVCMAACSVLLAACGNTEETYTVTYYDSDAKTVLKTEEVEEGGYATKWTPTKEGYNFVDWYATPNYSHVFEFDEAITADTSVFALWSSSAQVDDTRDFYIVGQGSSSILIGSSAIADGAQMTKTEGENAYTLTVNLFSGDWFQFVADTDWNYQHGYGYLTTGTLDGVTYFESNGSIDGTKPAKQEDIVCRVDGNYTFTLYTHPADDLDNPTGVSDNDTIEWTYNGDPTEEIEVVPEYYIKGENITSWANMYNDYTQLTDTDNDGVYTLSIYLEEGESFMFYSVTTEDGVTTEGIYINATNLDGENEYVSAYSDTTNLKALVSGMFTFSYNTETGVLSVTCDTTYTPETYVYYLDGNIVSMETSGNWGDYQTNPTKFALTDEDGDGVYVMENVVLTAGDELLIRQFDVDEDLTGNYGTVSYNYAYTVASRFYSQSEGGTNILITTSGTYNISFDSYSKIVSITVPGNDVYDIYINGQIVTGWNHNFADEYRMTLSEDETYYEITIELTEGDEFGFARFSKGALSGSTYLNTSYIGTSGDANSLFDTSATNYKCLHAGTYRIVYNIADATIDFYAAE